MSMELISKEKVKKLLNEGWYSGVYPSSAIMSLPTVKAIPIERLEQIRAEIEELEPTYNFEGFYSCQSEVIKIIDKALKEQNE